MKKVVPQVLRSVTTDHASSLPTPSTLGCFALFCLSMPLLLGACEDQPVSPEAELGPTEIWIEDYAFIPLHKYVVPGVTATWINRDTVAHTVVSGTPDDPGRWFESGLIEPGESYSVHFEEERTYRYHCSLHAHRLKVPSDIPVLFVTPQAQPLSG